MKMKRLYLLIVTALTAALSVQAQIPMPPDPACVFCGVNLKTNEAHKRGCRYYSEPTNEETSSSSSSSSSSTASKPSKPTGATATTKPVEQKRLSFECTICHASILASNGNEAIREFANNPWYHKPTCQNYKPKPGQNTSSSVSTKLKDYTPAQELPVVSKPLIDMPLRQPAPQFSSINESNIRHEKPVSIVGKHEWGEVDEGLLNVFESDYDEDIPREFDIERYNHDGGAVILGTHKDNGRYHWTILCHLGNGAYTFIPQKYLKEGLSGYKNIGKLRDVHFEGQGKYIIAEYTSGYRQVYDSKGNCLREGYNIKVLDSTVEGKSLIYVGEDEQTSMNIIFNEDGEVIASGHNIKQYDDALIVQGWDWPSYNLYNWHGEILKIDESSAFEEIKAYNNNGSYYLLKDKEKGYAVVGRGFIRVGNWYDTEEKAHQAWKSSRGN